MKLSVLGEFGLIDRIKSLTPIRDKSVMAGIGDDTAVIRLPAGGQQLLLTTDTLVEGIHFDLDYFTFYDLGWKLLAVNISDIAAMGGEPRHALITLGVNENMETSDIDRFYEGIRDIARIYNVDIVGGDVVDAPEKMFFTLALSGYCKKAVLRGGAKPGDAIVAVGEFGGSYVAMQKLKRYGTGAKGTEAHLRPEPMVSEGRTAAKYATSMIDNSDGLARCLIEICRSSGTGARLYIEDIPYAEGATLTDALEGGEDYNLVMTVPKNKVCKINKGRVIGEITKGKKIKMIDRHGACRDLVSRGYEHL